MATTVYRTLTRKKPMRPPPKALASGKVNEAIVSPQTIAKTIRAPASFPRVPLSRVICADREM